MIGSRLLHYEIVRLLGQGGMGEVYLARDTKLGRDVAVKLLPADLKNDENRRLRFEREAQAVAALNHPNVVTIHAVEEAEGRPFLVMELVEGDTLDAVIPGGGLPTDRFFQLALDLTGAVAAAHARGITHRDLKPQNVMIDREGRLKVLDFGLAKLLETPTGAVDMTMTAGQVTGEGVIVGTAAYMSPEQAEGKAVDVRSDVFSLGVLIYQMVTGQQPFQGDTKLSTLTAVLRDDPRPVLELRPDLPRHLARIIKRCLEKDPARRFETARGIHYDLEALRDEIASGEHEKPDLTGPPPAGKTDNVASGGTHRMMLAASAVVLIMMVAVFGWSQRNRGSEETPTAAAVASSGETAAAATQVPTIVVFPFDNLGPAEDAYFAAGITEEIITRLTGLQDLRVVARTSAMHYDRTNKTLRQIADDLGVDYVLEGAVRWQKGSGESSSQVRVTPQLMNAHTDEQVWAQQYDRAMEEIFKVQSDIAGEVVRSLGGTLGSHEVAAEPDTPTQDMVAYHAYLKAKEILDLSRFDFTDWKLGVDLLEKATERDPAFHEAWVALAVAHSGICHFNWDRTEARLAMAKAAAHRAMALKPESPYSFYARGIYHYWGRKEYESALTALRQADRLRPEDPKIMEATAYVMRRQDAFEEAADLLEKVAILSPRDGALAAHLAETLAVVERFEDADLWAQRSMELSPDQPFSFTNGAWEALQAGRPDLARRYMIDCPPFDDAEPRVMLSMVNYVMRDYATALDHAMKLPAVAETQYRTVCRDLSVGLIHLAMDRGQTAVEDFTRAEAELAKAAAAKPDDSNMVAARAVALAGMGRHDEALAEVRRSLELFPANRDLWIRSWRVFDLARIQIMTGRYDDAVATLTDLMDTRTDIVSPAILDASPVFDPLRDRDDFKALTGRSI